MAEVWVAGLITLGGAGISAWQAHENQKKQQQQQDKNMAADQQAQENNFGRYLMERGINPSTGGALNTKLPIWAGIMTDPATGKPKLSQLAGPSSMLPGSTGAAPRTPSRRSFAGLGIGVPAAA